MIAQSVAPGESRSWNLMAVFVVLALASFAISWSGGKAVLAQSAEGTIAVFSPWTRATPAGASTGIAYMTLRNSGKVDDRLVTVSSEIVETVKAHETIMQGTTVRMRPVGSILLRAGGVVHFKASGLHFMLLGLKQSVKQGHTITMTLTFERAGPVKATLPVARLGSTKPQKDLAASHPTSRLGYGRYSDHLVRHARPRLVAGRWTRRDPGSSLSRPSHPSPTSAGHSR